MQGFEFDITKGSFRKVKGSVWSMLLNGVLFLAATFTFAVLVYLVFSAFVSTDTEKRLKRENRLYERVYAQMQEREALLGEVITGLQVKDDRIYRDIFGAPAPSMDPLNAYSLYEAVDVPDEDLVAYTREEADMLLTTAVDVESNFQRILAVFEEGRDPLPPMSLPLEGVSYAQIGASTGSKINPFYQVPVEHTGLDIIANQGEPVLASAAGYVSDVITSRKGLGNVVEITHEGGYVTRYAHLADVQVRKGANVVKGTHLGNVGISGNSFAPHLHYEVLRGGRPLDPVQFFFASVGPEEYLNMLYMSVSTGQSMD